MVKKAWLRGNSRSCCGSLGKHGRSRRQGGSKGSGAEDHSEIYFRGVWTRPDEEQKASVKTLRENQG